VGGAGTPTENCKGGKKDGERTVPPKRSTLAQKKKQQRHQTEGSQSQHVGENEGKKEGRENEPETSSRTSNKKKTPRHVLRNWYAGEPEAKKDFPGGRGGRWGTRVPEAKGGSTGENSSGPGDRKIVHHSDRGGKGLTRNHKRGTAGQKQHSIDRKRYAR